MGSVFQALKDGAARLEPCSDQASKGMTGCEELESVIPGFVVKAE